MVVVVVRWGTEHENMILLDARAHGRPRKGLASRRWTGTGKESSSQVEEMVDCGNGFRLAEDWAVEKDGQDRFGLCAAVGHPTSGLSTYIRRTVVRMLDQRSR